VSELAASFGVVIARRGPRGGDGGAVQPDGSDQERGRDATDSLASS